MAVSVEGEVWIGGWGGGGGGGLGWECRVAEAVEGGVWIVVWESKSGLSVLDRREGVSEYGLVSVGVGVG